MTDMTTTSDSLNLFLILLTVLAIGATMLIMHFGVLSEMYGYLMRLLEVSMGQYFGDSNSPEVTKITPLPSGRGFLVIWVTPFMFTDRCKRKDIEGRARP